MPYNQIPARDLPTSLIYTLHDDNVGLVPQLATGSLHEIKYVYRPLKQKAAQLQERSKS